MNLDKEMTNRERAEAMLEDYWSENRLTKNSWLSGIETALNEAEKRGMMRAAEIAKECPLCTKYPDKVHGCILSNGKDIAKAIEEEANAKS